jgi:hypothetical protein
MMKSVGSKSIRSPFKTACKNLEMKDLKIHDFRHISRYQHEEIWNSHLCGWKSVQMFMRYDRVADEYILQTNVAGIAYVERKKCEIPLTDKLVSASKS